MEKAKWIDPKEESPLKYDGVMLFFIKSKIAEKHNIKNQDNWFIHCGCALKLEVAPGKIEAHKLNAGFATIDVDDILGWMPFPETDFLED